MSQLLQIAPNLNVQLKAAKGVRALCEYWIRQNYEKAGGVALEEARGVPLPK